MFDSHRVCVATLSDLDTTGRLICEIDGISILLCRTEGKVVAVSNICTHLAKPLAQGRIMGGCVYCPFHGACFDLHSGTAVSGPAIAPIQCYKVEIAENNIFVYLPAKTTIER